MMGFKKTVEYYYKCRNRIFSRRIRPSSISVNARRVKYVAWRENKDLQNVIDWYDAQVRKAKEINNKDLEGYGEYLLRSAKGGLEMFVFSCVDGDKASKQDFINCILVSRGAERAT